MELGTQTDQEVTAAPTCLFFFLKVLGFELRVFK
jgi:hypothetical protein